MTVKRLGEFRCTDCPAYQVRHSLCRLKQVAKIVEADRWCVEGWRLARECDAARKAEAADAIKDLGAEPPVLRPGECFIPGRRCVSGGEYQLVTDPVVTVSKLTEALDGAIEEIDARIRRGRR